MINVLNLTQSYGNKTVIDSATVTIEKNEVCALVGRNGAGKSTFIHSLLGLLPLKNGSVFINGKEVTKKHHDWKKEIAYLPEKFMLYPTLTGWENLLFFAEAIEKSANHTKMEDILKSVRLWEDRHLLIKNYSKGMLQRLGLAVTLYQSANILILDEPTSGLDPMGRKEILDILRSLSSKTILLSSHHLDEIQQVCTHVIFLNDKRLEKYTVEQFFEKQRLGETTL